MYKQFTVKYGNLIVGVLIGAINLYLILQVFSSNVADQPVNFQAKFDSLKQVSAAIELKQRRLDTLIGDYNGKVVELDYRIKNIKEKTVIVREYYHEISKQADTYNVSQVDSFLRNRYGY